MNYLPTKYTQNKIEYKKWAYYNQAYKIYPRPAIPLSIVYLQENQKIIH